MTATVSWLECTTCHETFDHQPLLYGCPSCAERGDISSVEVRYQLDSLDPDSFMMAARSVRPPSLWRWSSLLPPVGEHQVTLGEGDTPLAPLRTVTEALGVKRAFVKHEASNPTGSFKDRLNAVAVGMGLRLGFSASHHLVLGKPGRVARHLRPGCRHAGDRLHAALRGDQDPHRADASRGPAGGAVVLWRRCSGAGERAGQKPRLVRIQPQLPAAVRQPVRARGLQDHRLRDRRAAGNGSGLGIRADGWWRLHLRHLEGVPRAARAGCHRSCPPHGCLPGRWRLHRPGDRAGSCPRTPVPSVDTLAVSIRHTRSGDHGIWAVRESDGGAVAVEDDEITAAVASVGRDGLCLAPSSAASVAGAVKLAARGELGADETVVCIGTATCLRWSLTFAHLEDEVPLIPRIDPDLDQLNRLLAELAARGG